MFRVVFLRSNAAIIWGEITQLSNHAVVWIQYFDGVICSFRISKLWRIFNSFYLNSNRIYRTKCSANLVLPLLESHNENNIIRCSLFKVSRSLLRWQGSGFVSVESLVCLKANYELSFLPVSYCERHSIARNGHRFRQTICARIAFK